MAEGRWVDGGMGGSVNGVEWRRVGEKNAVGVNGSKARPRGM